MNTKDIVNRFIDYGISIKKIAEEAQVNKISIVSLRKNVNIKQITEDKILMGLKKIALELYTITYSNDNDAKK